jgi:hypothetical protein
MANAGKFDVGRKYSPRQLLQILGLPRDATRGAWFNGYQRHGDELYGDFSYAGLATLKETRDTTPATILWACGGPMPKNV